MFEKIKCVGDEPKYSTFCPKLAFPHLPGIDIMRPTITFITPNCHESSPPEGARQGHVQRTLRTTTENAERESGIDTRAGCKRTRHHGERDLPVGIRLEFPANFVIPADCRTLRIETGKRPFTRQLKNFEKFSKSRLTGYLRNAKIPSVTFAVRQDNNQDTPYSRFSLPRTSQFGSGRRFFLCSGQDVRKLSARMSSTPFLRIHLP